MTDVLRDKVSASSIPGLGVIIMAAGLGKRMKSALAKVLHPVAGRPMVLYVLDIACGLAEQGVALESNSWSGVLARTGTPDAVVARVNAEINKALLSPAVTKAFADGGIVSLAGSPTQFGVFIRSEIDKYADVTRRANITADN